MSPYFPYKIKQTLGAQASLDSGISVVAEKYNRHVVVNGAGDSARAAIETITKKHPSTSIVFDASADGVPTYNSGAAVYGFAKKTKLHIFNGEGNQKIDAQQVAKSLSKKLGSLGGETRVKELSFIDGVFKENVRNKIDRHILINADHGDPAADYAVAQLAAKHPTTTTVVIPTHDGNAQVLSGSIEGGGRNAKFEVVGHGAERKIGTLSPEQIVSTVARLSASTGTSVEKLTLVGCESLCNKGGIVDEVRYLLNTKEDIQTRVKGYSTPIIIDGNGHKLPVSADTVGALGKNDPLSPGESTPHLTGTENDPHSEGPETTKPNHIWEAYNKKMISMEAAEFLSHVKNKVEYDLQLGPVFLGEAHNLPSAWLLTKQLLSDGALKRAVLESVPIYDSYELADNAAVEQALAMKGYSSLDDYFSNFDLLEKDTTGYKIIKQEFAAEVAKINRYYAGLLRSDVLNNDIRFDFIDSGRLEDRPANDLEEITVRNIAMAEQLNSDLKYKLPGVLGIFGAEHLRRHPTHNNTAGPAVQELVDLPQYRTYDLTPLFNDYSTGKDLYRWSQLSDSRPLDAGISEATPYKPSGANIGEPIQIRKYKNQLVLNAAGEHAQSAIDQVRANYPSTSIVFNAQEGGNLEYVDGAAASTSRERLTKVFLFADKEPALSDKHRWLTLASNKLYRAPKYLNLREFHLTAEGTFEFVPPSSLSNPVPFNDPTQ